MAHPVHLLCRLRPLFRDRTDLTCTVHTWKRVDRGEGEERGVSLRFWPKRHSFSSYDTVHSVQPKFIIVTTFTTQRATRADNDQLCFDLCILDVEVEETTRAGLLDRTNERARWPLNRIRGPVEEPSLRPPALVF